MTNDILCIIPARKGSKGIVNKNRQSISGVPLFVYSVRSALQSGIDGSKIIVSSDDEEILYLASKWKVNPYKRSSELSQDNSSTEDCLIDVINNIDITGIKSVLLLQPTSPIRFKNRIEDAIETYKNGDYDSLISVSKFYPFFWHYKYDENLKTDTCVSTYDIQSRPMRQKLTKYDIAHFENGNIYITDINVLINTKCRIGSKPCLYEISDIESMQIDSFEQLETIDIIISSSSGRFLRKEIKNDKKL